MLPITQIRNSLIPRLSLSPSLPPSLSFFFLSHTHPHRNSQIHRQSESEGWGMTHKREKRLFSLCFSTALLFFFSISGSLSPQVIFWMLIWRCRSVCLLSELLNRRVLYLCSDIWLPISILTHGLYCMISESVYSFHGFDVIACY